MEAVRQRDLRREIEDRVARFTLRALAPFVRGRKTRRPRRLGIKLSLDTDRYIDYLVYMQGAYEPHTLRTIDRVLGGWDRPQFLDVGANIGLFCTYVAVRYPKTGVVAFEPIPDMADEIETQQRLNRVRFPVERAALSDAEGSLDLFFPLRANPRMDYGKYNPGMVSAHPSHLHGTTSTSVPRTQLDSLVGELVDPDLPTFVKIDVEGHEAEVLRGMESFLDREPPTVLAVEMLPSRHPQGVTGAWGSLTGHGFGASFIGRRHLFPCDEPRYDGMYFFQRSEDGED